MEKLYFTFGSDPQYPYGRDAYVMAIGTDVKDCIEAYRKKHPNRAGSDAINCADYYTEKEWKSVIETYYKNTTRAELIVSDAVYGQKPDGYDPIWFYVPFQDVLIYLQEGSGDNLSKEDIEVGNVAYLDYTVFDVKDGEITEDDGGELLLSQSVQERYDCLADAIPDILEFAYNNMVLDAMILKRKRGLFS